MSRPPEERQVVVLGASPKPGRYSNQAVRLLLERGFRVTSKGITLVTPDMLGQQLHYTR